MADTGPVCLNPKPTSGKCPDGYIFAPVAVGRSLVPGCKPATATQNTGPTVLEPQSLPTEAVPPPAEAPKVPFYKAIWFWGVIGTAAVGGLVYMRVRQPRQPTVTLGDITFEVRCPGKHVERHMYTRAKDGLRLINKLKATQPNCAVTIEE